MKLDQFHSQSGPGSSSARDTLESDWRASVEFYNAADGDHWTDNANWSNSITKRPAATELDAWYGVFVAEGRVTELDLSGNNLVEEIPSAIGQPGRLELLDLSDNSLSGEIPGAIGDLRKLKHLELSDNSLRRNL